VLIFLNSYSNSNKLFLDNFLGILLTINLFKFVKQHANT